MTDSPQGAPAPLAPPGHEDGTSADRPWERLDAKLAEALTPVLPDLADEIVAEIAREIPGYRRPIEGTFGRGLRAGVREALGQFVALVGRPGGGPPSDGGVYRGLGRGELRAGRSLDALQAAYRLGARIAWRRVAAAARAAGADADQMSLLAEAIFAYIDEISSQSVEGYARAQAAVAGERQRRRERLVRLMVSAEERPQEEALLAAAAEAGWPLPRRLAALVADGEDGARMAGRLAPDAIAARVGELTCVLLPDPGAPGLRAALARAGEGTAAALGPAVAPLEARLSYARARAALRLHRRGVLAGDGLIVAEQHLGALLLFRDARLLGELAEQRLGPLAALAPAARERLEQTLLCWLRHQGAVPAVALELHVHRQTVRYRLARLRELLGDALDEPDARLELELALRGRALRPAGSQTIGPAADGPDGVDAQVSKP